MQQCGERPPLPQTGEYTGMLRRMERAAPPRMCCAMPSSVALKTVVGGCVKRILGSPHDLFKIVRKPKGS